MGLQDEPMICALFENSFIIRKSGRQKKNNIQIFMKENPSFLPLSTTVQGELWLPEQSAFI
jgi:hypothetical protein